MYDALQEQVDFKSITPENLLKKAEEAIALSRKVDDEIAAETNPTFENTFHKFALRENALGDEITYLTFLNSVSSDEKIRDESTKAEKLVRDFSLESLSRRDVYKNIKIAFDNLPKDLDPEKRRLAERHERDYRRNGLGLSEEKLAEVLSIKREINTLRQDFNKTLNEENKFELLSKEELEGVNDTILEMFEKEGDKYKITFNASELGPVLKFAKRADIRKKLDIARENKVTENSPRLQKTVELRQKLAEIRGYKNHADYVMEVKMAKTGDNVWEFLQGLRSKLKQKHEQECKELLELKNEDLKERGLPQEDVLYNWDLPYYTRVYNEKKFKVDSEKFAEYFPTLHTVDQMFLIFEKLFALKFVEIEGEDRNLWHPDVRAFKAFKVDSGEPKFIGYIYNDMYPRQGKYGHAADFEVRKAYTGEDGKKRYCSTALVCNFPKPSESTPSLLRHGDVVTLFHELGHGIHDLVADAEYSALSGIETEADFVEAPSQMLENWTWDVEQLINISKHYKTGEKLPRELAEAQVKSKSSLLGVFYTRQLFFGIFDQTIHRIKKGETVDVQKVWVELSDEMQGLSHDGFTDRHGFASIGHFMNGYDAGYYGYLWSLVYASDMFYTKFKKDPLDQKVGLEYRDKVIGQGGKRDSSVNLREFLGRDPNSDAFFKEELGVN